MKNSANSKKGEIVKGPLPYMESVNYAELPASFNWQDHGVVGPVSSEGQCGASYVYTIVDSISSIYAISENKTYAPLSIEQVATCTQNGCTGGDSDEILKYIEQYGVEFDFQPGNCPKSRVTNGVCIKGSQCVKKNETALAEALISEGPIYVAVDGGLPSFQMYEAGVYSPPDCSSTNLDTSLLLVGYNEQAWICQNHWGTSWGMKGYIWIARNKNNMCGIATAACYPTGVAKC